MRKIIDYKLVAESEIENFNKMCCNLIENGYYPLGGVDLQFCPNGGLIIYAQAMIKFEPVREAD